MLVGEHPAVAVLGEPRRSRLRRGREASGRDAVAGVWSGVGDQLAVAVAGQCPQRRFDDRFELFGDGGVNGAGLAVHPGDGGAGEDVVELVQQHHLPQPVEILVRVLQPSAHRGGGRPQLCLAQEVLAAAVATLSGRLRGVGPSVQL